MVVFGGAGRSWHPHLLRNETPVEPKVWARVRDPARYDLGV